MPETISLEKIIMHKIARPIAALCFAALTILSCHTTTKSSISPSAESDSVRTVTIFYTNDEEGHLEPSSDRLKTYGGAANLMNALRERGYRPDGDDALLLSGGDMWTGPAISTWFQGASTVQVMNAMGYDAAAIGNHEFDFGQEILQANEAAADFPFLSANIQLNKTDTQPDFSKPYIIRNVNGVSVAIIGLTTLKTPTVTMPTNVEGITFTNYAEVLQRTVPQARAEGAELPIVIAHVCSSELRSLIPIASKLSIPLLAGGHCHAMENFEQDGVRIVEAGAHLQAFAKVDITLDTNDGRILSTQAELVPVEYPLGSNSFTPDPDIEAIVAEWSTKAEKALGEVIGYSETGIERGWQLFNLLVDSWLWSYPEAGIAISNFGGFRAAIPPGEITRADIMAVWPFRNVIVDVELTGKQITDNLLCCGGVVAGLTYRQSEGHVKSKLKDGRDLDPEATYRVLINNFIYAGGDNYLFQTQNPNGYNTEIPWQEPVIKWIIAQKTSPERPLETLLDSTQRGPARQ